MEALYTDDRRLTPAGEELERSVDTQLKSLIMDWMLRDYDPKEIVQVMHACTVQLCAEAMQQITNE